MKFAVPQFIDVEDKILGPLTLKQGIYLVGSGGAAYLFYALFGAIGFLFLGVPLVLLAALFAFVKVNNRPFVSIASAAFFYTLKNKLYLWKKTQKKQSTQSEHNAQTAIEKKQIVSPQLTQSRLRALAFSLDTEAGYNTEDA